MRSSTLISIVIVVAALAMARAHAAYTVTVDPSLSTSPTFSLTLPAHHGNVLETRAQAAEIKQPRCDTQPLNQIAPGQWAVPGSCRRVEWTVDFIAPTEADAARTVALHSVAFPGWWSVMEQNALLRVAGEQTAAEIIIKTKGRADVRAYVPAVGEAPEIYVLGNVQETVRRVGGVRVRYVSDNLALALQRGMVDRHTEALRSLQRLFPTELARPFANDLLVVMVGNSIMSSATGAGGARSLVFDYPRDNDQRDMFVFMTLAHEQFHQLRAMHNNGSFIAAATGSPWLEEGLAHYYGIKTVQRSELAAEKKAKVWNAFIDPQAPVTAGLVELNRRFKQGDSSVYPLFYQQGATFFAELDRTLREASGNAKSLDDFVTTLKTTAEGELPETLIAQWRALAGTHIDRLLALYVGS